MAHPRPPYALRRTVFLVVLALVLAALALWLTPLARRGASLANATPLALSANAQTTAFGSGFVSYDGRSLTHYGQKAQQTWARDTALSSASMAASHPVIALFEGTRVEIYDDTGESTYSAALPGTIVAVRADASYIAIQVGELASGQVIVMDRKTNQQIDTIDYTGTTLVDFGFYSDSHVLWTLTLDTAGITASSRITTYQPGSKTTGSASVESDLVYRALLQRNEMVAVGTTHMRFLDYTGAELSGRTQLVYGWRLISAASGKDGLIMLFVPNAQLEGTYLEARLFQKDTQSRLSLPSGVFYAELGQTKLYAAAANWLYTYELATQKRTDTQLPFAIERVVTLVPGAGMVVLSSGAYYFIALR